MRFQFQTKQLQQLYSARKGGKKYSAQVADAYIRVVETIRTAKDERDLYALKSLHYEKLKGHRAGQKSLRLNDQYRLVVETKEDEGGKYLLLCEIGDYH